MIKKNKLLNPSLFLADLGKARDEINKIDDNDKEIGGVIKNTYLGIIHGINRLAMQAFKNEFLGMKWDLLADESSFDEVIKAMEKENSRQGKLGHAMGMCSELEEKLDAARLELQELKNPVAARMRQKKALEREMLEPKIHLYP